MRHYVFYVPNADKKLQELIADSADPKDLVKVAKEIDRWLVFRPLEFGESRYANVRVAFVKPLGIQFELLDDPPTVIVLDIWRTDRG